MFGMEKGKQGDKKEEELWFDLQKDIAEDPTKYKKVKGEVKERVQTLKSALRSGADKENYDKYGMLLHGYVSLQKVIKRVNKGTQK